MIKNKDKYLDFRARRKILWSLLRNIGIEVEKRDAIATAKFLGLLPSNIRIDPYSQAGRARAVDLNVGTLRGRLRQGWTEEEDLHYSTAR